ncbi:hypothetical protein RF11_14495 [Thelohanellus kitauei]|uniref:Uncharacterized protein n=1 Tax=Thelohanellus kitauei TaxID=669202 RepID=A0A0C2NFX6_THEKT|nr:hypothetical protein RF11_14495 [Thelohanellus kitauei]
MDSSKVEVLDHFYAADPLENLRFTIRSFSQNPARQILLESKPSKKESQYHKSFMTPSENNNPSPRNKLGTGKLYSWNSYFNPSAENHPCIPKQINSIEARPPIISFKVSKHAIRYRLPTARSRLMPNYKPYSMKSHYYSHLSQLSKNIHGKTNPILNPYESKHRPEASSIHREPKNYSLAPQSLHSAETWDNNPINRESTTNVDAKRKSENVLNSSRKSDYSCALEFSILEETIKHPIEADRPSNIH